MRINGYLRLGEREMSGKKRGEEATLRKEEQSGATTYDNDNSTTIQTALLEYSNGGMPIQDCKFGYHLEHSGNKGSGFNLPSLA